MSKFNVGDRVRFVGLNGRTDQVYSTTGSVIEPGDLGTVTGFTSNNKPYPYSVEYDNGLTAEYMEEQEIEKYEEPEEPRVKFQTGDTVIAVQDIGMLQIGRHYKVDHVEQATWSEGGDMVYIVTDYGSIDGWYAERFALVSRGPEPEQGQTEAAPETDEWRTIDVELGTYGPEDYARLGLEYRVQVREVK